MLQEIFLVDQVLLLYIILREAFIWIIFRIWRPDGKTLCTYLLYLLCSSGGYQTDFFSEFILYWQLSVQLLSAFLLFIPLLPQLPCLATVASVGYSLSLTAQTRIQFIINYNNILYFIICYLLGDNVLFGLLHSGIEFSQLFISLVFTRSSFHSPMSCWYFIFFLVSLINHPILQKAIR